MHSKRRGRGSRRRHSLTMNIDDSHPLPTPAHKEGHSSTYAILSDSPTAATTTQPADTHPTPLSRTETTPVATPATPRPNPFSPVNPVLTQESRAAATGSLPEDAAPRHPAPPSPHPAHQAAAAPSLSKVVVPHSVGFDSALDLSEALERMLGVKIKIKFLGTGNVLTSHPTGEMYRKLLETTEMEGKPVSLRPAADAHTNDVVTSYPVAMPLKAINPQSPQCDSAVMSVTRRPRYPPGYCHRKGPPARLLRPGELGNLLHPAVQQGADTLLPMPAVRAPPLEVQPAGCVRHVLGEAHDRGMPHQIQGRRGSASPIPEHAAKITTPGANAVAHG